MNATDEITTTVLIDGDELRLIGAIEPTKAQMRSAHLLATVAKWVDVEASELYPEGGVIQVTQRPGSKRIHIRPDGARI